MQLTSFTDYGLRILMRLAGDPERSFTTDALAREFALSRHHLQKVVQALGAPASSPPGAAPAAASVSRCRRRR